MEWCCALTPPFGHTPPHVWVAVHPDTVHSSRQVWITPLREWGWLIGVTHWPLWSHPLPVLPNQTAVVLYVPLCRPFPNQLATSCSLRGKLFLFLRPIHSLPFPLGKPPTTPQIFPSLHRVLALMSINLSSDPRAHYTSYLSQGPVLHTYSGRLSWGKAAKVVAPVPKLRNHCCTPRQMMQTPPSTLGKKGDGKQQSPNKILHNHSRTHEIPLAILPGRGPITIQH